MYKDERLLLIYVARILPVCVMPGSYKHVHCHVQALHIRKCISRKSVR